jgi:Uma2 family endonuclease
MLAKNLIESHLTEQDYLEGEKLATVRHEYVDGKVYAMAGSSLQHNDIAMNIAFALRLATKGTPCRVNASDIKVKAEKAKSYYYPDVLLSCEREASEKHYVTSPCLIVEVTSPSTEWKDRHQKTVAYQKLDALQAYWIVEQNRLQVTVYFRNKNGEWDVALYDQEQQSIVVPCTEATLTLADIYEGVGDLATIITTHDSSES